jgi:hypothetical protein
MNYTVAFQRRDSYMRAELKWSVSTEPAIEDVRIRNLDTANEFDVSQACANLLCDGWGPAIILWQSTSIAPHGTTTSKCMTLRTLQTS